MTTSTTAMPDTHLGSSVALRETLKKLSSRVGPVTRSGDALFCRTALMWVVLGPSLSPSNLIDAIGMEGYTPIALRDLLHGLVSLHPINGCVIALPGLHEAVDAEESALGFSDSEGCYVIASRCLETCAFPFLEDGTPLDKLGRDDAVKRAYSWSNWWFFFERAGKLDTHIEEKFDNMVKRILHSLTSLVTLLAEQTTPCTAQTQPCMPFHARLEENGGLVLLYRALRKVLVAVRRCLAFECYAKALPLRPDTESLPFGPGSMRRRRKRVSFADETFPDRAQEEEKIIRAFRALERSLRIVAAIYNDEEPEVIFPEIDETSPLLEKTQSPKDDCAILSDDEDEPLGRNARVRRWFLDAAGWARNMADVYPAAAHTTLTGKGLETVVHGEYLMQRPYIQCGSDSVRIPFIPWVAGVVVSAVKSPFAMFGASISATPLQQVPMPTSPALVEKVASSNTGTKTLSIAPVPKTSFAAVPINAHSPLASLIRWPRDFGALKPANLDDAWRAAKHALLRGGILRTLAYFIIAILLNHIRRMFAPWLGQYVFHKNPLGALKLANSSPEVFLEENLNAICLRSLIAMELQKLLLDLCGAMAGNVLRWAAVFDVDSPRPGKAAVDVAVVVYLLTAMANLEYLFCRGVYTAAFSLATLRLGSPAFLPAHHHEDFATAWEVLVNLFKTHSPLVLVIMVLNLVFAFIPLIFNAVRKALFRGQFGLVGVLVIVIYGTIALFQTENKYFLALELSGGLVALGYTLLAAGLIMLDALDDPLGVHVVHERLIKQIYRMGDVIFIDEVVDLRKLV